MLLVCSTGPWAAQGYKTFFMLNSIENKNLIAHMYENIKKFSIFQAQDRHRMLFFPLINAKMPTIVGILTFMSGKNFMLNGVEHEKSFITLGPVCFPRRRRLS